MASLNRRRLPIFQRNLEQRSTRERRPSGVTKICLHGNLIACVELGRTLSRKVNTDAFLFKATKGS
jgi:hypothetical protein